MLSYVTNGAVVTCLHGRFTVVARVDELILSLIVQLVQHRQRGELGTSQR